MPVGARSVAVETLENRLLCARTPTNLNPDSIGRAFDLGERQALLSRMTNLPSHTYSVLQKYLTGHHTGAFDDYLLSYMRTRTNTWFYNPSDASSIASYVKNNLSITSQTTPADKVTDDRLFPASSAATTFTVQLPDAINWNDASPSKSSEYLDTLNRQGFWVDLAQSYKYTGNSKYITELKYELASWSQQDPSFTPDPKHYEAYGLTMGLRVDFQMQAYFSVLTSDGWSSAANSLMLYKFMQQGDALNTVNANLTTFDDNRTVAIGKALQFVGEVLPEFDKAAKWETAGRKTIVNSMNGQFYADGSHREQSPGYALNVLDDLLDAKQLDNVNGIAWSTDQTAVLVNAVDALWQQLSPNGKRPAIGDTYRLSGAGEFLKASLVLGVDRWPENRANNGDAWHFGTAAISGHLHDSGSDLAARGSTASFPDSGNYVLRSDDSASARQINYIAGPKGGPHGHYDYMSFELFGYGRPLIADPGPYIYGNSAQRTWAVSAAAHNTISVTGTNPSDLEDANDILNSGISQVANGYMMSSTYAGYSFLDGNPVLSRSIWYDGNNTMVIVDFASAASTTSFETGFTVEGQNTGHDLTNGTLYTKNASGGNVRIQSLLVNHETSSIRTAGVFTSNTPEDVDDPATHYYASAKGTFAVFATVITAFNGTATAQTNNVSWSRLPTKAGQSAILNVNGTPITFQGPQFATVGANGQTRGTSNDIAYDSKGRLHMVYYDRDTQTLKYAIRSAKGVWGNIETVDGNPQTGANPSLVIDNNNLPRVAYTDSYNGDLKYAYKSPDSGSWVVQTVDVKGSTGAYPSLVLGRGSQAPIIAYYNKTSGDLRVAISDTDGWHITTVDSKGDVGRYPSITLDPNRPTATKYAVSYEDTTDGTFKYAIQSNATFKIQTLDPTTTAGGGYTSMAFFDDGADYEPAVSYYDAAKGHLKYATRHGGVWSNTVIASRKRQGLYSNLLIVNNQPLVFFFDGLHNTAYELTGSRVVAPRWSLAQVATGGRELHTAVFGSHIALTTLDESTGFLSVVG